MRFNDNAAENARKEAEGLLGEISALSPLSLDSLEGENTMAVFVDIVNGFIKEGAMASARVGDIIPPNAELLKKCGEAGLLCAAFADCHGGNAAEFASFPPHCVKDTSESEIVDELKAVGGYTLIPKNSTNGFNEKQFRTLLDEHKNIRTFIVTGDCTDICVLQFCLALKTSFTAADEQVRIIVPVNCTETYDAPWHGSDFANLAAYKLLKDSGIEFVSEIL